MSAERRQACRPPSQNSSTHVSVGDSVGSQVSTALHCADGDQQTRHYGSSQPGLQASASASSTAAAAAVQGSEGWGGISTGAMIRFCPASQALVPRGPMHVLAERSDRLMLRIRHMYKAIEQGQEDMRNLCKKIEEYQEDMSRCAPGSGEHIQLMQLAQQASDDITRLRAREEKMQSKIQGGSEHFDQYLESVGLDIGRGRGPAYGYAQRISMDDLEEDPELDAQEGWREAAPPAPHVSVRAGESGAWGE